MEKDDYSSFTYGQIYHRINIETEKAEHFKNLYLNLKDDFKQLSEHAKEQQRLLDGVDNYVKNYVVEVIYRNED